MFNIPCHMGIILPNFFDKTYLPIYSFSGESSQEKFNLHYLLDRINVLIKTVFLFDQARRVHREIKKERKWYLDAHMRLCLIDILGNSLEIFCWLHSKNFFSLKRRERLFLEGVSFVSKILVQGHLLFQSSLLIRKIQERKRQGIEKTFLEKEVTYSSIQIASHLTFITAVALSFISMVSFVTFPNRLLKILHVTSIVFGYLGILYQKKNLSSSPFYKEVSVYLTPGSE